MQQAERLNTKSAFMIGLNWKTFRIAAVLIATLWFGWNQFVGSQTNETVQTGASATAFIGDLSASTTASGSVEAVQAAELSVATAGIVNTIFVREGDPVAAGDVLLKLDAADLQIQVERAEQVVVLKETSLAALLNGARPEDIAAAKAAVVSTQAILDNLVAGPSEFEIAEYEANLRADQANVASAAASYNSTLSSVTDAQIAQAKLNVINAQTAYDDAVDKNAKRANGSNHNVMIAAQADLEVAQQALNELLAGPSQGVLSSASGSISAATANLNGTQANYDALLAGASAQEVASAEANLAQAQANLAKLLDSAPAQSIAIAEEGLRQAEISLLDAQDALADATLVAPFAGTVTSVDVAQGEYAAGTVVELVSTNLKVTLEVDELDIGQIALGQTAAIDLEAFPDAEIAGEVVSIAPSSAGENGVATFDVTIALGETYLPIRVGMTANANLITADFSSLLLIPSSAIIADRMAETYTVNRILTNADGETTTETVDVTIGLRDQDYTEIVSGLDAGDEVVIGQIIAPVEEGGFGPGR